MSEDLLGDGNPTPPPSNTPPSNQAPPPSNTIPAPEWLKGFDIDPTLAGDPSLKAVNDIPNLVKSFVNAQKMIGADKVVLPKADASAQEWSNFWAKVGKPESVDKYELSVDEKLAPKEFVEAFKQEAFKHNILPKQAQEIINWMAKYEADQDAKYINDIKAKQEEAVTNLKKEWGDAFGAKINSAKVAIMEYGGDELMSYLKSTGLSNDPQLVKLFSKIGEGLIKEDPIKGQPKSSFGLTKEDAQERINKVMSDFTDAYHNPTHADHHRRVDEVNKWFRVISA